MIDHSVNVVYTASVQRERKTYLQLLIYIRARNWHIEITR